MNQLIATTVLALGIHYGYGDIHNIHMKQYDGVVFEREKHPVPPHGLRGVEPIAYVPLSGFNTTNTTHEPWIKRVDAIKGWILDK